MHAIKAAIAKRAARRGEVPLSVVNNSQRKTVYGKWEQHSFLCASYKSIINELSNTHKIFGVEQSLLYHCPHIETIHHFNEIRKKHGMCHTHTYKKQDNTNNKDMYFPIKYVKKMRPSSNSFKSLMFKFEISDDLWLPLSPHRPVSAARLATRQLVERCVLHEGCR